MKIYTEQKTKVEIVWFFKNKLFYFNQIKSIFVISLLLFFMSSTILVAKEQLTFSMPPDATALISRKVLEIAYSKIGIDIKFNKYPAERSLYMSNHGLVDGEVCRIKGIEDKYLNLVIVPVPINLVEGMVFTKNVKFKVAGWSSLKPYTIGVRRGTKFIENIAHKLNVEAVTTNEQLFLKLISDRTDIVVTSRVEGLFQLKKLKINNITVLEPPIITIKLYHYLNKKHKSLIPKVTNILKKMNKRGTIYKINNNGFPKRLK